MQKDTIWGPIQTSESITPGIRRVSTAAHGGYLVSEERLRDMPAAFPHGAGGAFEEDCAWCFVVLSFPGNFSHDHYNEDVRTCKNWFPREYEA